MSQADIGVYGLGTMGRALSLNLAERGAQVAISNREVDWIAPFVAEAGALADRLLAAEDLAGFVQSLKTPRLILFMIPSGDPMDEMIAAVTPLLDAGEVVIDAGNADFHDTRRRAAALEAKGLHHVGMGVSGGEEGARHGPSLMVGGSAAAWDRLQSFAESIAARFAGDPCVAHLGRDGAGHFVKTVHNGIEYADMQMIAEVYGLLRDAGGWPAPQIGAVFARWNDGPLESFLTEITARALRTKDVQTGGALVDAIRDSAGQKGTGRWTVIEALKLGQSASVIEAAVGARNWSAALDLRHAAEAAFAGTRPGVLDFDVTEPDLEGALHAGRLIAHAQGFALLAAASETYGWKIDMARVAEIWRAGCIIRASVLDEIAAALRTPGAAEALFMAPHLHATLAAKVPHLRRVVGVAVAQGVPVPALSAALAWFDSMTRARGTTNLIQAQRDIFGRHGFERRDMPGNVNADWRD